MKNLANENKFSFKNSILKFWPKSPTYDEFLWLPEEGPKNSENVEKKIQSDNSNNQLTPSLIEIFEKKLSWAPLLIFIFCIFLVIQLKKNNEATLTAQRQQEKNQSFLSISVPIIPIAKGRMLQKELFQNINIATTQFTKKDLLNVFKEEDLNRLDKIQFSAKKDLPPNRPLFWRDIEIQNHKVPINSKAIRILSDLHHPKEGNL